MSIYQKYMRYKLLLLDLDGTLVKDLGMPPKKFTPSTRLKSAIQAVSKKVSVCLCTGRDKATVLDVIGQFGITTPQIIEGGAKIIYHQGKEVWAKYLSAPVINQTIKYLKNSPVEFSIIVNGVEIMNQIPLNDLDKITSVFWYAANRQQTNQLQKFYAQNSDVQLSVNQHRGGNTIYITHQEGTKTHGISKLQEILKVTKDETIGVGDGNNDVMMFAGCGFKVAMGNAVPELKKLADFITLSVKKDGVADVIEKFILK